MTNVPLTYNQKKALLVFGTALILFLLIKPKKKKILASTNLNFSNEEDNQKDRKKMDVPTLSAKDVQGNEKAKNGFAALKAYISAYNIGEPHSVLNDLNREFAKEFKVKVYRRKSDGKLVVCDLSGKEILVNN
jgi:hypothetical protein